MRVVINMSFSVGKWGTIWKGGNNNPQEYDIFRKSKKVQIIFLV